MAKTSVPRSGGARRVSLVVCLLAALVAALAPVASAHVGQQRTVVHDAGAYRLVIYAGAVSAGHAPAALGFRATLSAAWARLQSGTRRYGSPSRAAAAFSAPTVWPGRRVFLLAHPDPEPRLMALARLPASDRGRPRRSDGLLPTSRPARRVAGRARPTRTLRARGAPLPARIRASASPWPHRPRLALAARLLRARPCADAGRARLPGRPGRRSLPALGPHARAPDAR